MPRQVAVDSRGIVYASDSQNGGELDRYDTLNANGGGVGFLASIPSSVNEVQRFSFYELHPAVVTPSASPAPTASRPPTSIHRRAPRQLADALKAACGAGNVFVRPDDTRAVFIGALGARDVPQMTCTVVSAASALASCSVTTLTEGRASTLLPGASTFSGNTAHATTGLAVDPDTDGAGPDADVLYVLRGNDTPNAIQQLGPVNDPGLTAALRRRRRAWQGRGLPQHSRPWLKRLKRPAFRLRLHLQHHLWRPRRRRPRRRPPRLRPRRPAARPDRRPSTRSRPRPTPPPPSRAPSTPPAACSDASSSTPPTPASRRSTEVLAKGCASLDPDGGPQPISQRITGLVPNTHYFVRLRTTRAFDTAAVFTSASIEFDTDSVPPVISDIGAIGVQDTTATLVGTIDPRNSATGSYVFSYGTTLAADEQTTASVDIGGGTRLITVSRQIEGLAKDTDYFFRLIATNEFGPTQSPVEGFHTRAVPFPRPPDNCPNAEHPRSPGLDLPRRLPRL